MRLRGLNILSRFSFFFSFFFFFFFFFFLQGSTFVTFHLFSSTPCTSEKGSTLKGKNLIPWEVKYVLLEKTPFQKGGK